MRRRRLLFRGGMAVLLMAALLTTAQASRADEEPEWYPGLPNQTFGAWANASQGSMSYAKRAKQWFVSPTGMTVAEFAVANDPDDPEHLQGIDAGGYFVSPKGAPANYGYLQPMTVRSVGFGLMPVEATVQVSQRRENGLPIPVKVRLEVRHTYTPRAATPDNPNQQIHDMTFTESKISDSFNVQILAVKVDGVDLGLNGDCRTVEPAPVVMTGPSYTILDVNRRLSYEEEWYRSQDPSTFYNPQWGGELRGTMTIPPFTGCTTTAGDDLSDLLTLSASGPDNPVVARSGYPCPFTVNDANAPAPPGVSNPKLGGGHARADGLDPRWCPGVKPFVYPEREDR